MLCRPVAFAGRVLWCGFMVAALGCQRPGGCEPSIPSLMQAEGVEAPGGELVQQWSVSIAHPDPDARAQTARALEQRVGAMAALIEHPVKVTLGQDQVTLHFPRLEPLFRDIYTRMLTLQGTLCVRDLAAEEEQQALDRALAPHPHSRAPWGKVTFHNLLSQEQIGAISASAQPLKNARLYWSSAQAHFPVNADGTPAPIPTQEEVERGAVTGLLTAPKQVTTMLIARDECAIELKGQMQARVKREESSGLPSLFLTLPQPQADAMGEFSRTRLDQVVLFTDGDTLIRDALVYEPLESQIAIADLEGLDSSHLDVDVVLRNHGYRLALEFPYPKGATVLIKNSP